MNRKNVIMFGGKGGVGKTTCAAAAAIHYASLGEETIIISTDLTPSLRDIFELERSITPVKVAERLHVAEIGYEEVKKLWDKKFGPEAIYELEVADFPLIVAIDSRGKSIFRDGSA